MIDSIAGAFGALKGAAEITQGLLALKTDTAVSTKVVELNRIIAEVQHQLFAAQADYAAAVGREHELKAKIVQLENWSHEQERYQLHQLAPGTLVYRVKPAMQGAEPVHDLCTHCYQEGVKSILQNGGMQGSHRAVKCPRCNTTYLGERVEALSYVVPSASDRRL